MFYQVVIRNGHQDRRICRVEEFSRSNHQGASLQERRNRNRIRPAPNHVGLQHRDHQEGG